jgi:putative SOS response-associated peptidase YedK
MGMCYHLSLIQNLKYLEKRFGAPFEDPDSYEPAYHKAAFSSPAHAVITGDDPKRIALLEWGLVPRWVKDDEQAESVRKGTMNAKAETVFQKPSFRSSIKDRRCLVLADGFFEWQQVGARKYPYYIRLKTKDAFAMAGIWDTWNAGGIPKRTFSIITTEANPLVARIHNMKKRMPAILPPENEGRWLEKGLTNEQITEMLRPYDENRMEAYTVSRAITAKDHVDAPGLIAPFEYKELKEMQDTLY